MGYFAQFKNLITAPDFVVTAPELHQRFRVFARITQLWSAQRKMQSALIVRYCFVVLENCVYAYVYDNHKVQ